MWLVVACFVILAAGLAAGEWVVRRRDAAAWETEMRTYGRPYESSLRPLSDTGETVTVLRKVSKAVGAGLSAGVAGWVVANQVGGVTGEEWGGIVGALLFTAFVTFLAPANKQPA